jgi:hypothetical protein
MSSLNCGTMGTHRWRSALPADERGIVLVFVLLAMTMVTGLILIFLLSTTVETKSVSASRDSKLALYAADAAIQEVIARVNFMDRTLTRDVNGTDVRVWIPKDLINTSAPGYDADNPNTWRYIHQDGVNNTTGSPEPCDSSEPLHDCSGVSGDADDWGEFYPSWRVNIWYADNDWMSDNAAALPPGQNVLTLLGPSQKSLLVYGLTADGLAAGAAAAQAGIFVQRKLDASGRMVFTDGTKQFTAAQATAAEEAGGLGMLTDAAQRPPAWPVMEIYATGRFGGVTRRRIAEAGNFPIQLPETALYACGEGSPTVDAKSKPLLISGYDYPMFRDGDLVEPGPGNNFDGMNPPYNPQSPDTAPVPSITVCCSKGPGNCVSGDEQAAVSAQVGGLSNAELYGLNTGDGNSIAIGELDVQALYESYVPYTSSSGCGASGCAPSKNKLDAMGTESDSVVAHFNVTSNNTSLNLPSQGFGVLLINTNGNQVKITGGTTIYGLVIVVGKGGELDLGGTIDIIGQVLTGTDVDITGNAKIFYSRDALSRIPQFTYIRLLRTWEASL